MAEKAEEDSKKKEEDAANAAIFAKTIKPLFQERCYECHKGDGAKAKLDLSMFEDDDTADLKGIFSAINKGNSGQSTLLQRIKDANDPMPPEGKGEMFTAEQADELAKWIDAGAPVPEPSFDSDKIVSIVTMLFKGILPIAFILILHYLTGVLFNAGDSLIKSTPSRLSASGLMKAMALVVLLSGIAAAAAGIVYGILGIMDGFSDNWLSVLAKIGGGVLLYLFCASLARLWLKPAQLNIKIGAGNTAGDEALGIMAMFSKTMLKIAPILYGMALIFCLLFALMNLVAKDDIESAMASTSSTGVAVTEGATTEEGFFKSISNLTKETLTDAISYFKESPLPVAKKYLDKGSVLKMAIKIPVYLFAYFLFSYVLVEALRALFSLPGRRSS
jgi:mono/diheme cytochrome c family protein